MLSSYQRLKARHVALEKHAEELSVSIGAAAVFPYARTMYMLLTASGIEPPAMPREMAALADRLVSDELSANERLIGIKPSPSPPYSADAISALSTEVERLRSGYAIILNSADSAMADGDLARVIAEQMLKPMPAGDR